MNIFIWSQFNNESNNKVITDVIKSEHEAKGDVVYNLVAEDATLDEASIAKYQEELKKADFVYINYPIHWGSYPNKLKATIDSVLTYGFAYEYTPEGMPNGLLFGKKAKIITTSGHPNEYYVDQLKAIHYLTEKTLLGFVGIETVSAINFGGKTHGKTEGFPIEEIKSFVNN